MKKVLISLLALLMVCSAVFATEPETEKPIKFDAIDFTYNPTVSRYNAMGQSGLADTGRLDSFFSNPANLSQEGFGLAVPSVAVTVYNINSLISDTEAVETIGKIMEGTQTDEEITNLAVKYIEKLGKGYNTIMTADAGLALKFGPFGLGTSLQLKMHALNNGTSVASQKIIPELNAAETVAIGLKVLDSDVISVSAGFAGHAIYKAYLKDIGATTVIDLMNAENMGDTLLWNFPIMAGTAVTFDVGATVGLWRDQILFSVTANNINGIYNMKSYTSLGDMINPYLDEENKVERPATVPAAKESVEFKVETPFALNFGFAFKPEVMLLNPTITADLVDMLDFVKNFDADTFRAEDLLLHLNVGAEFDILNIVRVRAGINRGYFSVGAGVNLFVIGIDASYGFQEFGAEIGDKKVDSFTIKFNLGFDK